ncbi:MAG: hypothetical protein OXQ29_21035 [Rhodospirillaceae bacterium]|nr:hypothetical protein [Rhodospirillaceae bacterium]
MLSEGGEADEHLQQPARKFKRLAERGAMSGVEMDEFVAGLPGLPATMPAAEWLPQSGDVEL